MASARKSANKSRAAKTQARKTPKAGKKRSKRPAVGAPLPFPVVCVGVTAGERDAVTRFFGALSGANRFAFVVVEHGEPGEERVQDDVFQGQAKLPVHDAEDGAAVESGHIYRAPREKVLTLEGGVFRLKRRLRRKSNPTPVDDFLRSLADDQGENAVAVILSGAGADGALGIKAIKEAGGIVLVQAPEDAVRADMPEWALSTRTVDFSGSAEALATAIVAVGAPHRSLDEQPSREDIEEVERILTLIKSRRRVDFTFYKRGTLHRRIGRRMGLAQVSSVKAYRERLEQDESELTRLARDFLIGTTRFFRDPEAFEYLGEEIVTEICRRHADEPVRIWVAGASTGEEAYSIAMVVFEQLAKLNLSDCQVQIFATDIDADAIEHARIGTYPDTIETDISPERLERFFTRENGSYRVKKQLRDAITFAVQNVITDPPFSRIDLVVCRNLLIYLLPDVQQRVLEIFHFALARDGCLFVGPAESVSERSDLFRPVDKQYQVYRRANVRTPRLLDFPWLITAAQARLPRTAKPDPPASLRSEGQRMLQTYYTPSAVLVNKSLDVQEIYGDVSDYLQLQPGPPTMNVVDLALPALRSKLRTLLHQHRHDPDQESSAIVTLPATGTEPGRRVRLSMRRIGRQKAAGGYLLVFRPAAPSVSSTTAATGDGGDSQTAIQQLEEELTRTRDELQSMVEQLETANEELKATNEEVMSMNEEYQSTNEELETSKEELLSTNQELATVNSTLEEKLHEIERKTNDLNNLLESTTAGTIFLDADFRVKLFTPAVTELVNLIDADVGRPFRHIAQHFNDDAFMEDAQNVLTDLAPREREIEGPENRHYLRRILPYRTKDGRVDGVVITFVDITARKHAELHRARLAAIVEGSDHAIIGKTLDGIVTSWNQGAEHIYGYSAEDMIGRSIGTVFPPEISHDSMKPMYDQLRAGKRVAPMETVRMRKDGRRINVIVTISPVFGENGEVVAASTIATDITDHKRLESELQKLNAELEDRVAERTREAQERAEKLRRLAMQMTKIEQDERRRIARILHDTVQQLHAAAKMRIEQAKRIPEGESTADLLEQATGLIDEAIETSRALTVELFPPVLGHSGLRAALEWLRGWMVEHHNLSINLSIGDDTEPADTDVGYLLFETARELLFNVVKHSGVDETDLALTREGALLHLRVRDRGNGCIADGVPRDGAKDSFGLASMRERLDFIGGRLEISTNPGDGFCVDAWYPDTPVAAAPGPATSDRRVHVHETGLRGTKTRVVVVDDHEIVRTGIVTMLEDSGEIAVVGEASDGEAGAELARQLEPDVVLMDVNMPRMNGIEATEVISRICPTVTVIGLSVNSDPQTMEDMKRAGAAGYVTKGGAAEDLIALIKQQSTGRRAG